MSEREIKLPKTTVGRLVHGIWLRWNLLRKHDVDLMTLRGKSLEEIAAMQAILELSQ